MRKVPPVGATVITGYHNPMRATGRVVDVEPYAIAMTDTLVEFSDGGRVWFAASSLTGWNGPHEVQLWWARFCGCWESIGVHYTDPMRHAALLAAGWLYV